MYQPTSFHHLRHPLSRIRHFGEGEVGVLPEGEEFFVALFTFVIHKCRVALPKGCLTGSFFLLERDKKHGLSSWGQVKTLETVALFPANRNTLSGFQNVTILSESTTHWANWFMVLISTSLIRLIPLIPRASEHVPQAFTNPPFPMTDLNIRSRL